MQENIYYKGEIYLINDFVEKTVKLMKNSDIQVRMPEYRRVEIGQTNTVFIESSELWT